MIGICSGYFNPIHLGHIEYLNAARAKCNYLIVIVNSDEQVKRKGSSPFMDEKHRKNIVFNIKSVDGVQISCSKDKTVCDDIKIIKNMWTQADGFIFFNSGDRKGNNLESAEMKLCKKIGIEYQIIDLPKLYSSSRLILDACNQIHTT